MDYSSLKSGTDIRGIASNLGGKEVNLTNEAVYDITAAFISWYVNKFEVKPSKLLIAVGHDSRITGEEIETENDAERDFLKVPHKLTDFGNDLKIPGKLMPKRIPGGVVLVNTEYEIRAKKQVDILKKVRELREELNHD